MTEKNEVREILWELEMNRKKLLQPIFLELGLTLGQGQPRILNRLFVKDHITQKDLSQACSMDTTTMSRTIDKLEEGGLLQRRKRPDCRRSYLIVLTEQGREKARKVHEAFMMADDRIWKDFSQEEMQTVLNGLRKINANLCGIE